VSNRKRSTVHYSLEDGATSTVYYRRCSGPPRRHTASVNGPLLGGGARAVLALRVPLRYAGGRYDSSVPSTTSWGVSLSDELEAQRSMGPAWGVQAR
jgi:hypothetical protein